MSGFEVVSTKHGPMLAPIGDTYIGRALRENGVYAPEEFAAWAPYLTPESVVVDGGAHCGGFTAAFARACPQGRVIAVEPQRPLAYALAGSCALNGWGHVEVRNHALGRAGAPAMTVPRFTYADPKNYGAWHEGVGLESAQGEYRVPVEAIDAWRLNHVDFLKLDVEYAEWDTICGASDTIARCRPVIVAEFSPANGGKRVVEGLLDRSYDLWLQVTPYGSLWDDQCSINLIALPREGRLPAPVGVGVEALP